jgi:hypothetical protein
MNAKQLLAALAIVTAGGAAMAVEATQFDATPSTKTRDEVRAEMVQARLDGTLMRGGEATVFVDRPVAAGARSREEVREEGAPPHAHTCSTTSTSARSDDRPALRRPQRRRRCPLPPDSVDAMKEQP